MMNGKVNNVPKLRFKEFSGEWKLYNLVDLSLSGFSNGVFNDPKNTGKGYKLINVKDMYVGDGIDVTKLTLLDLDIKVFLKNKVINGDIFFTRSSLVPEGIAYSNVFIGDDSNVTYDGHLIKMTPNVSIVFPKFLFNMLKTYNMRKQFIVRGKISTMTTIGQEDISTVKVNLPSLKEQQKIAEFLSSVDSKLQALKQKHQLLQQYKKGMMQKLFSQQIRFKDENEQDYPEWEKVLLKTLSDKVTAKNKDESVSFVLTNSAKQGIVSQTDYFTKDIANENNLGNYTIVNTDDFVYNPRISELAPYGPIKRNHISVGVMSPLYTVFRFKDKSLFDYIEFYFETDKWHKYMWDISNFGARSDRMNISNNDFFNLPLSIPSKDERVKIANFLSAIDQKIEGITKQIEQTELFKKGLLQQLFV